MERLRMMYRTRSLIKILPKLKITPLLFLTALIGCSDSDNPGTVTPVAGPQPKVRFTECPFDTSKNTKAIRCGFLDTFENYEKTGPDARMIEVAFGIFEATTTPVAPDPIVVFTGGPGGSALADFATRDHFKSPTSNRDLIIVDQRGAGFSSPYLRCDAWLSGPDVQQIRSCVDRFVNQGVDLSQYRSAVIAQDFKVLREALGYEQWNVFGNSYGPIPGILYAELDSTGVRSVVFSSSTDNQVDIALADAAAPLDFISELAVQCAAETICSERISDLSSLFVDTWRSLNNEPWDIDIPGEPDTSGELLLHLIGRVNVTQYPALLEIIANRNGDQLLKLLASAGGNPNGQSITTSDSVKQRRQGANLMEAAVQCAAIDAENFSNAPVPTIQTWPDDLLNQTRNRVSYVPFCTRDFVSIEQDLSQREPRMLAVPALIIGGALDHIVSIKQVREFAESFHSPNLAIVQRGSHGVGFPAAEIPIPGYQHPCVISIFAAFLNNPELTLDMACLSKDIPPFDFEIGP